MQQVIRCALVGDPVQRGTPDLAAGVPQRFGRQRGELSCYRDGALQHLLPATGFIDQTEADGIGGRVGPAKAGELLEPVRAHGEAQNLQRANGKGDSDEQLGDTDAPVARIHHPVVQALSPTCSFRGRDR